MEMGRIWVKSRGSCIQIQFLIWDPGPDPNMGTYFLPKPYHFSKRDLCKTYALPITNLHYLLVLKWTKRLETFICVTGNYSSFRPLHNYY